ncbi:MAG: prolipoprotein diacylglyceryl transferase [Candidatus Riflebacteria bacterium]|nr:prolipoprotein diacylglyceryl transferase [Candidatus Riflebacteria bacterium]
MYPIICDLGLVKIGSYGVLLATAFFTAFLLANREFKKNGLSIELAWDLHFLALFGGLVGSKLMFVIEEFDVFLASPLDALFGGAGFSVLGGYLLAFILCWHRLRKEKTPFFVFADVYSPALAWGYAIGRLGCIMAGDGCYGLPTKLPWGMNFPNGIVSTLSEKNSMLTALFRKMFPGEDIPADITVHPTPLYESISSLILLAVLMNKKWRIGKGQRSAFFLIWFGGSRFFVEFIRLNPKVFMGLSSSQLTAIAFVIAGVVIAMTANKREEYVSELATETSDSQEAQEAQKAVDVQQNKDSQPALGKKKFKKKKR